MPGIDLSWVDEFVANVKPYIFVRLEDNLLIKRPNQVQKLNPTGAKILKSLLDGISINVILENLNGDFQKIEDVANFIYAIKHQLEGNLDEFSLNPAVTIEPFNMKFTQYPVLSEIAITYRCNLKCQFCYAGCNCTTNPIQSDEEMSFSAVKTVLDKLYHQAKVPSVSFTGGEPTLIAELPQYIEYAKRLGMRVNLISNGIYITDDLAKKLVDHGLDSVQISLEGVTVETHDEMVQMSGAFKKTISAIKRLKSLGIVTHTNTTLTKLNQSDSAKLPEFVKNEFGHDKLSMNLIIPTGSSRLNESLIIKYSEVAPILEKIQDESSSHNVELMWYSPIPLCMFNTILHGLGNKGCSTCDGLISIAPNGDVLPCASFDDSVGNILETDFHAIWQSGKAKMYRDKSLAHSECKRCEQFYICDGACPLYWRQMGFSELNNQFHCNEV